MNMRHKKTIFLFSVITLTMVLAISLWATHSNDTESRAEKTPKDTKASAAFISDAQIEHTNSGNDKQTLNNPLLEVAQRDEATELVSVAANFQKEVYKKRYGQANFESLQFDTMDIEQLKAKINELSLEIEKLYEKAEWLKERGYDDEASEVLFQTLELQGLSLKMSLRLESLQDEMVAQGPGRQPVPGEDSQKKDDLQTDAGMESNATRALKSEIQYLNSEITRLGDMAEASTQQGDHAAAREFTMMAMEYQTTALKSDMQLEAEKHKTHKESRPKDLPAFLPAEQSGPYRDVGEPDGIDSDPEVAYLNTAIQNLRNDADYYYQKAEMLSDSSDEDGAREMAFLAIENQIDADLLQLQIDDIRNNNRSIPSTDSNSMGRREQF